MMSASGYVIEVAAVIDNLRRVTEFVVQIGEASGRLGSDQIYHCELSIEEIFSNIIEHGFKHQGEGHLIQVRCELLADRFQIIIGDDAPPFNPFMHQPKLSIDDELSVGGWGLGFVMKTMDSFEYHRTDGYNWIILSKKYT